MRSHWSYDKLAIEFYKCDTTCYEYSLKNFHPGLQLKQIKKTFMRVLSFVTWTYSGRATEKLLLATTYIQNFLQYFLKIRIIMCLLNKNKLEAIMVLL